MTMSDKGWSAYVREQEAAARDEIVAEVDRLAELIGDLDHDPLCNANRCVCTIEKKREALQRLCELAKG